MILRIDHIGIAVNSVDDALKLYTDAFGIKAGDIEIETVEEQKVRMAMIPIGESKIELLESIDLQGSAGLLSAELAVNTFNRDISIAVEEILQSVSPVGGFAEGSFYDHRITSRVSSG